MQARGRFGPGWMAVRHCPKFHAGTRLPYGPAVAGQPPEYVAHAGYAGHQKRLDQHDVNRIPRAGPGKRDEVVLLDFGEWGEHIAWGYGC